MTDLVLFLVNLFYWLEHSLCELHPDFLFKFPKNDDPVSPSLFHRVISDMIVCLNLVFRGVKRFRAKTFFNPGL